MDRTSFELTMFMLCVLLLPNDSDVPILSENYRTAHLKELFTPVNLSPTLASTSGLYTSIADVLTKRGVVKPHSLLKEIRFFHDNAPAKPSPM